MDGIFDSSTEAMRSPPPLGSPMDDSRTSSPMEYDIQWESDPMDDRRDSRRRDDIWGRSDRSEMGSPSRSMDNAATNRRRDDIWGRSGRSEMGLPSQSMDDSRSTSPVNDIRGPSESTDIISPSRRRDDVWGRSELTSPSRSMDNTSRNHPMDEMKGVSDPTEMGPSPRPPMDDIWGRSDPTGMGPSSHRPVDDFGKTSDSTVRRSSPIDNIRGSSNSTDIGSSPRRSMDNIGGATDHMAGRKAGPMEDLRGLSGPFAMRPPPPPMGPPPPLFPRGPMAGQSGTREKRDDLMNMIFGSNSRLKQNAETETPEPTSTWGRPKGDNSSRGGRNNMEEERNVAANESPQGTNKEALPRSLGHEVSNIKIEEYLQGKISNPLGSMDDKNRLGLNREEGSRNERDMSDSTTMRPPSKDIDVNVNRQIMPDPCTMGANFMNANKEEADMGMYTGPAMTSPSSIENTQHIGKEEGSWRGGMSDPASMGPNFMNRNIKEVNMGMDLDPATTKPRPMDKTQRIGKYEGLDPAAVGFGSMNRNEEETNMGMDTGPASMNYPPMENNDAFKSEDGVNKKLEWWERGANQQKSYKFMGTSSKYIGLQEGEREEEIGSDTLWPDYSVNDFTIKSNGDEDRGYSVNDFTLKFNSNEEEDYPVDDFTSTSNSNEADDHLVNDFTSNFKEEDYAVNDFTFKFKSNEEEDYSMNDLTSTSNSNEEENYSVNDFTSTSNSNEEENYSVNDFTSTSNSEEQDVKVEGTFKPTLMWSESTDDLIGGKGKKGDPNRTGVNSRVANMKANMSSSEGSTKLRLTDSVTASNTLKRDVGMEIPDSTLSWSSPKEDTAKPNEQDTNLKTDTFEPSLMWSGPTDGLQDSNQRTVDNVKGGDNNKAKNEVKKSVPLSMRVEQNRERINKEKASSKIKMSEQGADNTKEEKQEEEDMWPLSLHHNADDIKKVKERKWKIDTSKSDANQDKPVDKFSDSVKKNESKRKETQKPNILLRTDEDGEEMNAAWSDAAPGNMEDIVDSFSSVGHVGEELPDSLVMWNTLGRRQSNAMDGYIVDDDEARQIELNEDELNSGLSFHFRMKKMMDKYVKKQHKGDGKTDSRA